MIEVEVKELRAELSSVRQELQQLAEQVERLSDQRLPTMVEQSNIVRIEGVQGGEPIVGGANVPVRVIVGLIQRGQTPEEIAVDYEGVLSLAQIHDALSYYYRYREEIESYAVAHQIALDEASRISRDIGKQRLSDRLS